MAGVPDRSIKDRSTDAPPPFPLCEQIGLAVKLEKHELLEFRRTSALLYKKNLR